MVGAATGTVTADQLTKLADVVREYAAAGHFTTAQSMVIVGITEENFDNAKRAVIKAGFDIRSIGRDVRQVKCCAGANLSPFGLQKTPPLGQQLEQMFRGLPTPMKFKISVSGCPNCCANTMLNDFGIHGMMNGWKIFIGGKMGTEPAIAQELARSVVTDDVSKYLASVLRVYREKAAQDERFSKTLARIGLEVFKSEVEASLETPYDDLIEEARNAREKAEESTCIEHIKAQ
jgi:NAD(P)H-nitrite reductase large subunit